MKRILIFVGMLTWGLVLAGICQAVDPKRPAAPPKAAQLPHRRRSPPASPGGSSRYSMPPSKRYGDNARRGSRCGAGCGGAGCCRPGRGTQAAAAKAAAIQAAQNAAAARNAANAAANTNTQDNSSRTIPTPTNTTATTHPTVTHPRLLPYGYYSPYGYIPPGTTPYVAYNPWTGAGPCPLWRLLAYYPSSTTRIPISVTAIPGQSSLPPVSFSDWAPIQQLMGVGAWFSSRRPMRTRANGNPNAIANGNGNGNAGNANAGLANNNPAQRAPAADPARKPAARGAARRWKSPGSSSPMATPISETRNTTTPWTLSSRGPRMPHAGRRLVPRRVCPGGFGPIRSGRQGDASRPGGKARLGGQQFPPQ